MNYIRELSYNDTLINRGRRMKAVHTPPLLPNLKTKTLTISNNHGFCSHSKRVKENDGPVILHMVICKIKGSLKPLMSFLIPHRNRRWWVGDPWNGQALRDIGKYQVHRGLDTGIPLIVSNFAFGMLLNKQAHTEISTSTCTELNLHRCGHLQLCKTCK